MATDEGSDKQSRKRPWIAAVLTALAPGLGHLYLRLWGRALLWVALTALGIGIAVPRENLPSSVSLEAVYAPFQGLSLESLVLLSGVVALCVVDAYLMAVRQNQVVERSERLEAGERLQRCPNCGKEVDPEIDFCHWCTTEIGAPEEFGDEE